MSPSPIPSPSPAPNAPSPPPTTSSTPPADDKEPGLKCQWEGCSLAAQDGDQLYLHLCNAHIGRKSTNNLCLTCKWAQCNTTCSKRDHITSHLRVHIPLKPHNCSVCDKSFKRPQDLKKHEKIHTEEHHAQHKHSKAVTVADPAFNSRIRAQQQSKLPAYAQHLTAAHGGHHSHSRSPSTADEAHTPGESKRGVRPGVSQGSPSVIRSRSSLLLSPADGRISSPLVHHADHHAGIPLGSWDYANLLAARDHPQPHHRTATKRPFDLTDPGAAGAAVDGFFRDMKKRRYATTYDAQMIESLSALSSMAFAGHQMAAATLGRQDFAGSKANGYSSVLPNMNPLLAQGQIDAANAAAALALSSLPSQALPGSPEELAIVNQFLVRLGEEIAAGNVPQPPSHLASGGYGLGPTGSLNRAVPSPAQSAFANSSQQQQQQQPQQNYFDANTLAALGIANVPGLNNGGFLGQQHQQQHQQTPASMYNGGHGARDAASLAATLNLGTSTALASANLYTHAAALAGLSTHHPANALSQLPASMFQQQLGVGGGAKSSEPERQQSSLSTVLGSGSNPSSPSAQSSSRSSAGAPSPLPGYVQPGGSEFAGVPTTREARTGLSMQPQILPVDSNLGGSVRKTSVRLQRAPPMAAGSSGGVDEEVDELEGDDGDVDGEALPGAEKPFTLPSAASLISKAEALEDSRAAAAAAAGHRRYPSEESESTPRSRRSSTPSSVTHRPMSSSSSTPLYPSLKEEGSVDVVLPPISSLVLDIPTQEQRMKHIELIKAMLVLVNTEYVKRHGDPWAQAAAASSSPAKSPSPSTSPRVGMLKKVEVTAMEVDSDGEDEDSDESLESEDELTLTPVASFAMGKRDVDMVPVA